MRPFAALSLAALMLLTGCAAPESTPATDPALEQRMRAIADQAWDDLLAKHRDAQRPEYRVERMITMDEWGSVIAGCMNDLGFTSVTDSGDGGILSGDMNPGQSEPYDIALYDCQARYPLDPKYSDPLTEEMIAKIYDHYVDELTPCVEGLGYDVPTAPSRQRFMETYATNPWNPLGDIITEIAASENGNDIQLLLEACPELPPDLY